MLVKQYLTTVLFLILLVTMTAVACGDKGSKGSGTVELKTDKDKISYSVGVNIGQTFKENKYDINADAIAQAIKDVISGTPLKLTQEQMDEFMKQLQTELSTRQEAVLKEESARNTASADSFLSENAKRKGIIVLPDSLQYEVIKEGTGPKPKNTDTVKVHFTGTLIDGTEFESSHKRGEPLEIVVNQVIPGWAEVLPLMNTGSQWKIYIPPKLAYGERRAGPIPSNSLLIFDLELIEIVKK